jgi:hypothetical protein
MKQSIRLKSLISFGSSITPAHLASLKLRKAKRGAKNRVRLCGRARQYILIISVLLLNSCITEFIPVIDEKTELLVVEGLITDQPVSNKIKISKSLPLGTRSEAVPLSGCAVVINDDLGNVYHLWEKKPGIYSTDSTVFRGEVGRTYTLQISAMLGTRNINYYSNPVEMKAVPPIDTVYYEKTVIAEPYDTYKGINGCQIYLDTHDPENNCRFYRWDFAETWKLRLLFDVPNQTCYLSENSKDIFIESTAAFSEDRIRRRPVTYISNVTDRLRFQYSILINQYSLDEEEYNYWKKLKNMTVSVGGLHDVIPSSIASNIICVENPSEKVLGYFSVSSVSSKRIFIEDNFEGIIDQYASCPSDTLYGGPDEIVGLGQIIWTLFDIPGIPFSTPRVRIFTKTKGCADCTERGTIIKPLFWIDNK